MTPVLSMMKPVPNPRIWNGLRRPVNGETSTSSLTVLIVTTLGSAACTIGARLTGSPRTMGDPDVARAAEGAGGGGGRCAARGRRPARGAPPPGVCTAGGARPISARHDHGAGQDRGLGT